MSVAKIVRQLKIAAMLATALSLTWGSVSYADDLVDGITAFKSEDYAKAYRILSAVSKNGDRRALFYLGRMLMWGKGVHMNKNKGWKLVRRSALEGFAEAQDAIGIKYEAEKDFTNAAKWYRMAAEQGFAPGQFRLGWLYEDGEGVLKSYVYAHMWYNIAQAGGIKMGRVFRDSLEKKMTAAQIAEAQRLARECVRKKFKGCE